MTTVLWKTAGDPGSNPGGAKLTIVQGEQIIMPSQDFTPRFLTLISAGLVLEVLGVLTLITNPGVLPDVGLGFSVPILFGGELVQGIGLLMVGSVVNVFAILGLQS